MNIKDLGIDNDHLVLAKDFSKKLRSDIFKAINHFAMIADVAEFSGGEKITIITAVLERLLVDVYLECDLSREFFIRSLNSAFKVAEKARKERRE